MNLNDAMGIAHPHFSIRDTFLTEAKKAVAFLERESSRKGYDIFCSDIEIEPEHLYFSAETQSNIAENRHYAEFALWFEDGQLMVEESGYSPTEASTWVMSELVRRWAPIRPYKYELSPYHSDPERL